MKNYFLMVALIATAIMANGQDERWYTRTTSSKTSSIFCKGDARDNGFLSGTLLAESSSQIASFLEVETDGSIQYSQDFGLTPSSAKLMKLASVKRIPDVNGNDLGYVGVGRIISDQYTNSCSSLNYHDLTVGYASWVGFIAVTGGSFTHSGNRFLTSAFDDEVFYFSLGTDEFGNDFVGHTQPTDVIVDRNGDLVVTGFVVLPDCQGACEGVDCSNSVDESYRPFLAKYSVDFTATMGQSLTLIKAEVLDLELHLTNDIKIKGFIPTCILEDPAPTPQPYYVVGGKIFSGTATGQWGFPGLFQVGKFNATQTQVFRLVRLGDEAGMVNDLTTYDNGTEKRLVAVGELGQSNYTGFIAIRNMQFLGDIGFVEITDNNYASSQDLSLISIHETCNSSQGIFAIEGATKDYPIITKFKIQDNASGTYTGISELILPPCFNSQIGGQLTKKRTFNRFESSSAMFNNSENYLMLQPTVSVRVMPFGKLSNQYVATTDQNMQTPCSNPVDLKYEEVDNVDNDWTPPTLKLKKDALTHDPDKFNTDITSIPSEEIVCTQGGVPFQEEEVVSTQQETFSTNTEKVSIYPNPTTGEFHIESTESVSEISVYSVEGELVKQFALNAKSGDLDLNELPIGTYILQIEINGSMTHTRVVKQ